MRNAIRVAVALAWLSACSGRPTTSESLPPGVGLHLADRDTTIEAGDDFYQFANGGWLRRTTIPPDRGEWGSFDELQQYNDRIVRSVLISAADDPAFPEGTDQRKAADFFSIGMDSALAEKNAFAPLKEIIGAIESISNKEALQRFLADDDLADYDAFFSAYVSQDAHNSKKMAMHIGAGGIGLPESSYYLLTDQKSAETRERYKAHMAAMFRLVGWDAAHSKRAADIVFSIEHELAASMLTKEEKRDPVKRYNKRAVTELATLAPFVQWPAYFTALGVHEDSVIVTEIAFVRSCDRVVNTFSLEDVKSYLRWSVLRTAAPYLHHAIVNESFQFNRQYLLGTAAMSPRWQRVLDVVDSYLGEATGKLYVAETFPPEAKERAADMVENIRLAFAQRIKDLEWMSDSTKLSALQKLAAMTVKIGYPDRWKSYAGLIVDRTAPNTSYYGNVQRATRFQNAEQFKKLGKPVDRNEWHISPQTVNAFYRSKANEIVFPAGILQPPFFDYRADDALNYGGIGAVIGHEISHGFDDEGSQYDGEGNLRNWWRTSDLRNFRDRGKALVSQFNKYQPLPGLTVQGEFTLGENIGDLGGLNAAYEGLLRHCREAGITPGPIDGMTMEQRFFMSWATIWRAKLRDEALRTWVLTDEHAPEIYRVNGPLSNMQSFYEAFKVRSGQKLFREPAGRVVIW